MITYIHEYRIKRGWQGIKESRLIVNGLLVLRWRVRISHVLDTPYVIPTGDIRERGRIGHYIRDGPNFIFACSETDNVNLFEARCQMILI
jgi:hypothetical protein